MTTPLTLAQEDFATSHHVSGAIKGPLGSVFLYRTDDETTCRWLVNPGGDVADVAVLHRSGHGAEADYATTS